MIAFTILGLLVFWWFCGTIGYFIAMCFDATAKWDAFMRPYTSELDVLIKHLSDLEVRRGKT